MFVEFRLDTDMMRAMQDVRDKIAQVRPSFPRDVKDPLVVRADNENQEPVVSLAVMSPTTDLRELTSLTDQTIVKGLENVPGVARIDVNGRITRQILVQIKPNALTALGIGVDQVMNAIRTANQDVPAGRLVARARATRIVRVEGKIKDPAQFGRIIVAQQGGGARVPVAGRRRHRRREGAGLDRAHQRPPVDHARRAEGAGRQHRRHRPRRGRCRRGAAQGALPEGRRAAHRQLRGRPGREERQPREETIIEGALLTVLIVFLFLHSWRSTIITGLTLPIAVIATFIALYAFGFTLNFLTLMALSLCIGLLIDDAIVVRENIVRHLAHGQGPQDGGARRHRRDRPRGDGDDVRDRRGVRARSRS